MAAPLLNVNEEMNKMRMQIDTISRCSGKVSSISKNVTLYQTNMIGNIFTIITTVYVLLCAVLQFNIPLLWGGVILCIVAIVALVRKTKNNDYALILGIIIVTAIASAIIFFMIVYTFVPLLTTLVLWLVTIYNNYRMKNLAYKIASEG